MIERLLSSGPPWLVAIEGMGGIGKTSLADAVARRAIGERLFADIGWVSARQYKLAMDMGLVATLNQPAVRVEELVEALADQLIPGRPVTYAHQETFLALQAKLKQSRHLIVIDNLETVLDLEQLLPTLRQLSNPSRFLLTSRESRHYETGFFHFPLPELSATNAIRLIRYEAALSNSYLAELADASLQQIVAAVGGNPLALRLVVGQTQVFPLEVVLQDLTEARGQRSNLCIATSTAGRGTA